MVARHKLCIHNKQKFTDFSLLLLHTQLQISFPEPHPLENLRCIVKKAVTKKPNSNGNAVS